MKALLSQISPAQHKKWRAKKPYSASFASLEYSECWKPCSTLVGLIWSMRLLGTQWVRKQRWNLWKLTFFWISSFERWNHWRKIPRKSYPNKTHISPMGTKWVRPGCANIWKVAFIWISSFERWNHWRKFSLKKLSRTKRFFRAGTQWARSTRRNIWKRNFLKIFMFECLNN